MMDGDMGNNNDCDENNNDNNVINNPTSGGNGSDYVMSGTAHVRRGSRTLTQTLTGTGNQGGEGDRGTGSILPIVEDDVAGDHSEGDINDDLIAVLREGKEKGKGKGNQETRGYTLENNYSRDSDVDLDGVPLPLLVNHATSTQSNIQMTVEGE